MVLIRILDSWLRSLASYVSQLFDPIDEDDYPAP